MAQLYGETALPGSLPALFHDIFFNLSISTDSDLPDFRTRISEIAFFIFQLLVPLCTQRIKQNGADSKEKHFVNSIQECFYLNCSRVKLNKKFFIKFSGTSPLDHYYIIHMVGKIRGKNETFCNG